MSKLKYLHKVVNQSLREGVASTYEEFITESERGIKIKVYSKDKNGVDKITIFGKDNSFSYKSQEGDKTDERTLTYDDLVSELKKNKKLKFAADFVKTQKGSAVMGRVKGKKASSKKKAAKRGSAKKASSKKRKH